MNYFRRINSLVSLGIIVFLYPRSVGNSRSGQCVVSMKCSVKCGCKLVVQFSIEQATKAQRASRRIALLFLQPRR